MDAELGRALALEPGELGWRTAAGLRPGTSRAACGSPCHDLDRAVELGDAYVWALVRGRAHVRLRLNDFAGALGEDLDWADRLCLEHRGDGGEAR